MLKGEGKQAGTPQCLNGQHAGTPNVSPVGALWRFNPVNAGTGGKAQVEAIYAAAGAYPLAYRLHYVSRPANASYVLDVGQGRNWSHGYARRVFPDASGSAAVAASFVSLRRADGRLFGFSKQADGSYVPDADVVERLTRLADAGGATLGWQVVAGDDETETYDAAGKLVQLTYRTGASQTLAYDGSGRLSSVTDPFGRSMSFGYDPQNRVSTLTPPDSGVISFAYDGAHNLAGVTWPGGKSRTYHYEDARFPHHLTGITDENSVRYATWTYDEQGRAVSSAHAGGADAGTLSYGVGSTTVTDALGAVRTLNLTTVLAVVRGSGQSQPGGAGCGPAASSQSYDANGNVTSRTDFNGVTTTYVYDLTRNLETERVEAAGTPQARTIRTQWHASYRLPTKIAEPLRITTLGYDAQGNLQSRSLQATSDADGSAGFAAAPVGEARTWTWTHNALGQVLSEDGPLPGTADVTTTTYHPADDLDVAKRGQVATVTNALGHVTQITAYDANGRPLAITDPNNSVTTLAYDPRGRLTSQTVDGESTSYEYDGVGQLKQVTLPDGSSLGYTYDDAHRLTDIADSQGNRLTYTLDPAGNRLQDAVRDPQGTLMQKHNRVFDVLGRLAQDIGAAGQVTAYAYDANGNLTGVAAPLNRNTGRSYDALNRLQTLTDPEGGVTAYAYDGRDQLTQVSDPRGLVTRTTRDGLGQQLALESPDTGTATRSYDAAGRLESSTDAKGQTTQYQYDVLHRVSAVRYHDGSRHLYTYDQGANALGRLSQVEERSPTDSVIGSQQLTYDSHGRVESDTRLVGPAILTTAYQYSNGRLSGMTYPSGRQLAYQYDAAGRVRQIALTEQDGSVTVLADAIGYHLFGGVASYTNGAGQLVSRVRDQDGRISAYTLGAALWSLDYDAAARLTGQQNIAVAGQVGSYGYDRLDRLTGASLPFTGYSYDYDAVGNRTAQSAGAASSTYSLASTSNRLLASTGAEPRSYQYDANGSPTSDGATAFAYDARGRLSRVTTGQGSTRYTVNARGQRVEKSGPAGTTLYTYDPAGHLLAEASADGVVAREYVWLGDLPLAVLH